MRILHVISSGGMYGAESVILDLSRALRRLGHSSEIGVFANSARPNHELSDRATAEGIPAHILPCTGQLDVRVPQRLRALVRAAGFDLVHAHGYKADVYAYLALGRSRTPLVATCHNWVDGDLALRIYGHLDRFVLRRFAGVAAVSAGVAERLTAAGVRRRKIHMIRNGVDLQLLSRIHRSQAKEAAAPLRIGIVARLSPEKGVDLFVSMAALLAHDLPQAQFLVAGDGPERSQLEGMIANLGLEKRVTLLGRQENMPAFYQQLDLLVLASRNEGLPMAVLEGMASGLPVVATRVGELPEVVEDGRTGYIVPTEDPQELATAVRKAVVDPGRLRSMGAGARERVTTDFSAERMAADYLAFYRSVSQSA